MRTVAALLAALATPLMALAAEPGGDVGARIASSAVAAQGLQGPLDGTWALADGKGHTLFLFQLVDPASGEGALQAAWRRGETLGVAQTMRRGDRLLLTLQDQGETVRAVLHRLATSRWRGVLVRGGQRLAVNLVLEKPLP
jgi:hypothetical protein